jgi:hypothetical protein
VSTPTPKRSRNTSYAGHDLANRKRWDVQNNERRACKLLPEFEPVYVVVSRHEQRDDGAVRDCHQIRCVCLREFSITAAEKRVRASRPDSAPRTRLCKSPKMGATIRSCSAFGINGNGGRSNSSSPATADTFRPSSAATSWPVMSALGSGLATRRSGTNAKRRLASRLDWCSPSRPKRSVWARLPAPERAGRVSPTPTIHTRREDDPFERSRCCSREVRRPHSTKPAASLASRRASVPSPASGRCVRRHPSERTSSQ